MPGRLDQSAADHGLTSARQIVASSSDGDFLEHLIEGMRGSGPSELQHSLDRLIQDRDADIEHMCTSNHQEFVNSVNKLDQGRGDCTTLANEIVSLVQSYQSSTDNLAAQKKNLVDSRSVRQNIDESAAALEECLSVLQLANQVHELVTKKKHYYAALRTLEELQNALQIKSSTRFKVGDLIEHSIPNTRKMIAEAIMTDLNEWLFHIRDVSPYIGEVAFYETEQRRTRQKERVDKDDQLSSFKLNSPLELVADEMEEFDVLNNDEADIHADFTPLFECLHIHEALGQADSFRQQYAMTRRSQKDLIMPSALKLDDEELSELKTLMEGIAGFAIIERTTMQRTENLRSSVDVDELWDSMCQNAMSLISSAIISIDSTETLLKITGVVSLFVQTMESWQFYSSTMSSFLMTLFEKYANLLKRRCSEDFQEIVSTDDYMPMPVSNIEEYDKIIDVGWYTPDQDRETITFPCILPFSQMYPMCCIDIRNFLNQVYSAPDDYLTRSSAIDETIRTFLDDLLVDRICNPLIDRLRSQYPGQIVQIFTNLEHFETLCLELQSELAQARAARAKIAPVKLRATQAFHDARQRARDRVFELVNSKIDDLIETADYDWMSTIEVDEPSNYMIELTRYLSNIMSSVLLGLPTDIKDLIYYDALSHSASAIMNLPLDPMLKAISQPALNQLAIDVRHLEAFVKSLPPPASDLKRSLTTTNRLTSNNANRSQLSRPAVFRRDTEPSQILAQTITALSQTIALMTSENPEEYFDISSRDKKFAAVDPKEAPALLDKVERGRVGVGVASDTASMMTEKESRRERYGERFNDLMRGLRAPLNVNRDRSETHSSHG